ncbi:uracil-DNA glycosylase family protein [Shewanella sp. SR44-3]|nr:uracil-DNA glycosylase family protein [Shewanella sp. SR44-3]MBB1271049.1 uracil-DNA glycosylase family protein [Shewanella sp. SR44-3]
MDCSAESLNSQQQAAEWQGLIAKVRACTLCADVLTHGVRPVLQCHPMARILIAGQAPGRKVHESGVPFDDASGERLRAWLGVSKETFYDEQQFAILPMGFCYPGKGPSGDLAPLAICAKTWRQALMAALPNIKLILVIGQYAMAYHLPDQLLQSQPPLTASQTASPTVSPAKRSLTETVYTWYQNADESPSKDNSCWTLPLPHPSPRNNIWLKRNPWFEVQCIPKVQAKVAQVLLKRD